jgi:hypothetical protein
MGHTKLRPGPLLPRHRLALPHHRLERHRRGCLALDIGGPFEGIIMLMQESAYLPFWIPGGKKVEASVLARILPEDKRYALEPSEAAYRTAKIAFSERKISDFENLNEPSEHFFKAIKTDFIDFVSFLGRIDQNALGEYRSSGGSSDIFIDALIDQDQIEFYYPAEFIQAVGQLRLPIKLLSND